MLSVLYGLPVQIAEGQSEVAPASQKCPPKYPTFPDALSGVFCVWLTISHNERRSGEARGLWLGHDRDHTKIRLPFVGRDFATDVAAFAVVEFDERVVGQHAVCVGLAFSASSPPTGWDPTRFTLCLQ
jgi:hypothetical protein